MARSDAGQGAEAYPYDPMIRIESVNGLDRLRCIADRGLAANLFVLYHQAQHNTLARMRGDEPPRCHEAAPPALRTLAERALKGELGPKSKELAECMITSDVSSLDERTLREFFRALRELRKLTR